MRQLGIDKEVLETLVSSTTEADPVIDEQERLCELLDKSRVTIDEADIELDFLLKYKQVGILPRGDVVGVKGKAKAGKSHFLALLTAAMLNAEYSGFVAISGDLKVVWMDTEQGRRNCRGIYRKITQMANNKISNFQMFSLRSVTPQDRFRGMTILCETYKPDVLIVDGIRDLMLDPNEQKEAFPVIGEMMRLSQEYNMCIITVLHQNKKDDNMIGHAGSELVKKACEVYQVSKEADGMDSYCRITQTETRNDEMPSFCIRLDDNKCPYPVDIVPPPSKEELLRAKIVGNLDQIIEPGTGLYYSDLLRKYITAAICSASTAKRHITIAVNDGILLKDANGFYNRRVYVQSASC